MWPKYRKDMRKKFDGPDKNEKNTADVELKQKNRQGYDKYSLVFDHSKKNRRSRSRSTEKKHHRKSSEKSSSNSRRKEHKKEKRHHNRK